MLLRNFCEDGQIWVGDRDRGRVYPASPDRVFKERDLYTSYDLTRVTVKSDEDERLLGNIESKASPVVRRIIEAARCGIPPQLLPEGRVAWKQFFIAMARRPPEFQERVSFEKRHKDTFDAVCATLLGRNNLKVPGKASFDEDPHFSTLRDISRSNSAARYASGNHPRLQEDAERFSDETGICVAVIRDPKNSFVIGSHGLTTVKSHHPADSVYGSWLPIAHDVAVAPTSFPDKEILWCLDQGRDLRVKAINGATAAQSKIIAGRSRDLICSLMRG